MSSSSAPADLCDALAGRYDLRREIGRGGMGSVWLAWDLKHDRPVALKVLDPQLARAVGSERFLREIRVTARLQHPNVLPVFDSGEDAGQLWYTMPFVEGESLRARLEREGPLPLEDALGIVREVGAALSHAHSAGIIHRDVKPENVLLTKEGNALLCDFGVAGSVSEETTRLTATGFSLGTPAYMAPEQASGERQVDARADQYALGCLLFELLAGEPPFTGLTAQSVIAKTLGSPVPSVRTLRAEVPEAVDHALRRALAKVPPDRFESVQGLVHALSAHDRPGLRRKTVAVALAATGAAVAVAIAVTRSTSIGAGSDQPRSIAVLPFTTLGDSTETWLGDGVSEDITTQLLRIADLHVAPRAAAARLARNRTPGDVARALHVRTVLTGSVRRSGDRVRISVQLLDGRSEQALWGEEFDRPTADILTLQAEIARDIAERLEARITGAERERLASAKPINPEVHRLYLLGRHHWVKFTVADLHRAIRYFEQALAMDSTSVRVWTALGAAWVALSAGTGTVPPREAFTWVRLAAERALALDPEDGDAHFLRAISYMWYEYDLAAARRAFATALRLDPRNAYARSLHGALYMMLGKHDSALTENRAALALEPTSPRLIADLAGSYFTMRRFAVAESLYRAALEVEPTSLNSQLRLSAVLSATGRHLEAVAVATLAGRAPRAMASLAEALAHAGRRQEARVLLDSLEQRAAREYVDPTAVAIAWGALGEKDRAFPWLERGYADRSQELLFLDHPRLDPLRGDPRFDALRRRIGLPGG